MSYGQVIEHHPDGTVTYRDMTPAEIAQRDAERAAAEAQEAALEARELRKRQAAARAFTEDRIATIDGFIAGLPGMQNVPAMRVVLQHVLETQRDIIEALGVLNGGGVTGGGGGR